MLIIKQRIARGIDALRAQGVDMWIALGRELPHKGEPMLNYLLTYPMSGPVAVVLCAGGASYAINSPMEIEEIQSMGAYQHVITNSEGYAGMRRALADIVRAERPARIALNFSEKDPTADGLSLTCYRLLCDAFASAGFAGEVLSSQSLMKQLRAGRSAEEVAAMRAAVQLAMSIYDEARPRMKLGMSGLDIQRLFQSLADARGLGYSWPKYGNPFNSIGTRSSYLCKRPAGDVYIEPGDVVNVDFGIILDGASSDNQRTFYALRPGESQPPEEVQRAFDALGDVNRALCEHMRAGTRSGELLQWANAEFRRHGYPERRGGFGHEIGFLAHDGALSPGSDACEPEIDSTLIEGMTFTLEPAIITSHGRVCREEVVAVGRERGELLSTLQDEIWLIRD